MTVNNRVFIGLGSNVGDGPVVLQRAWYELGRIDGVHLIHLSRPYLSAPVDMDSENWFTNAVGVLDTSYSPNLILETVLEIEKAFGRKRQQNVTGYQDRVLDLDILLFNDLVSDDPVITLPHPEMANRMFVLRPLVEIAPEIMHPSLGKTIAALENELTKKIDDKNVQPQSIKPSEWS